jgi:hypothetical protein
MKEKTQREEWTPESEAKETTMTVMMDGKTTPEMPVSEFMDKVERKVKGQLNLEGEAAVAEIAVEAKDIRKFTAENDQAKLSWTDEAWEKARDPEGDPVSPRAFVQARLRIKVKVSITGDDWNNQVKAFTEKVEEEME